MDPAQITALSLSAVAALASLTSIGVVVVLARRTQPGIVARAAAQLEAHEADIDTRVRKLETDQRELQLHVESSLEVMEKAAFEAGKRMKAARRTEQANEARNVQHAGNPNVIDLTQYPAGHPVRLAAIEAAAAAKRNR